MDKPSKQNLLWFQYQINLKVILWMQIKMIKKDSFQVAME